MEDEDSPQPEACDCEGEIHPLALEGFRLFNEGRYWEAHEALESAWRAEKGQIRHLYRGILQVGVAYFHIVKANYIGAIKLEQRSRRWLEPFPEVCRGIPVAQIKRDFEIVMAEVRRLGPEKIGEFNRSRLPRIQL